MPELSLQKKAKRLRIYIGEQDRWRGNSLDNAILAVLRKQGIAGATVFRCISGYGAHSFIHTTRIEALSTDLPIVIETIDSEENINSILDVIYPMVREGLITIEDVEIVKYTHRYLNPLPADKLVSEVMTQNVVTLSPETSVQNGWKAMLEHRVKAVPVVDAESRVVGIVTDEDLLERAGIKQRLSVAIRLDTSEIDQELHSLESSPLRIKDVMTHPVITVLDSDTLGTATSRMVKSGLKRLPVIDADSRLTGVLSRLDILRQVAETSAEAPVLRLPMGAVRTVADIMNSSIPMVNQDDDLSTIIEKFSKAGSHRLIVVNSNRKAIGLISDADVVARVQPAKRSGILDALRNMGKPPASKQTAFDLMSPGPLTTTPDATVLDALKVMLENARKWMVVVDQDEHPLGLIDRQIMLQAIAVH